MKQKIILLFTFLLLCNSTVKAQKLVSYEYIKTELPNTLNVLLPVLLEGAAPGFPLPKDSVLSLLNIHLSSDIYKVVYKTTHPVLGEINATGAVAIPQGVEYECGLPMAIYQHGTTFNKQGVPSYSSLELNFGSMLAGDGYVTILPDYMGLGDSPGMHPYVHGKTEALAAIDLMRATRELQTVLDFELNGQNFIFGYSQGGHAAMALFYELETNYTTEFEATACAPMSGPYQISGAQGNVMWVDYATPTYLPYTIISYLSVYPDLKAQFPAIFNDEWGALNNFDGDSDAFFDIMDNLDIPSVAATIFRQDLLDDYVTDENHPLKIALRDNDYYDWEPKAPLIMMGCCDDEQVMIGNLYEARNAMGHLDNVQGIDWCEEYPDFPQFKHTGCIPFCLVKGKDFFDGLRKDCNFPTATANLPVLDIAVSPNPSNGVVQVNWDVALNGAIENAHLFDVSGKLISAVALQQNNTFDISQMPTGIYFLEIKANKNSYRAKVIKN